MATFSVIIPVYNIENYLSQCLDSVIAQTFNDLEIIVVDDGSTDSCPSICDRYAALDSRIQVIHKKNGGLVSARKAGARIATSDYIACVDGDDWIELDYFEKFASVVKEYSPDLICSGMNIQLKNGICNQKKMKEEFGYYKKDDIAQKIYPHLIGFCGNVWSKVFKRSMYLEVQLSIDEKIKIAEDACVVIPCVYKAQNMYVLEDCLYNYRYNPSSMTKKKTVFNLEEPKLIATHFEKHIDLKQDWFKQQIYKSTVHRLFNRCVSQFYQEKNYREICSILDNCLDDCFYKDCINKSKISLVHSLKNWLVRQALKRRMYRLMYLYSKAR